MLQSRQFGFLPSQGLAEFGGVYLGDQRTEVLAQRLHVGQHRAGTFFQDRFADHDLKFTKAGALCVQMIGGNESNDVRFQEFRQIRLNLRKLFPCGSSPLFESSAAAPLLLGFSSSKFLRGLPFPLLSKSPFLRFLQLGRTVFR